LTSREYTRPVDTSTSAKTVKPMPDAGDNFNALSSTKSQCCKHLTNANMPPHPEGNTEDNQTPIASNHNNIKFDEHTNGEAHHLNSKDHTQSPSVTRLTQRSETLAWTWQTSE
jgi:hypothetical protein